MLPDYPFATPPAAGETFELAPGIHWLRMPLPFALDHINLWLLADESDGRPGWTIIDTGFALAQVKSCWEAILDRLAETPRGARILRIIVTHFHPDHLGLATWLQEKTGAAIHMTLGEYLTAHAVWHESAGHGIAPMLHQFSAHGLDAGRCAGLEKNRGGYQRGVPDLPTSYQRVFDGEVISIGEHGWQVRTGFGHSPEHASLYCAGLGVLISGDMLLPKISTNISVYAVTPMADSLADYLESIDRYRHLPAATLVLPSHGLPFYGMLERIEEQHAHHRERLQVLAENCAQPHSAAELLSTLFPRELDTHQLMFAMGEAIAHLNHLEQAGRLLRATGEDGVIRFVACPMAP